MTIMALHSIIELLVINDIRQNYLPTKSSYIFVFVKNKSFYMRKK